MRDLPPYLVRFTPAVLLAGVALLDFYIPSGVAANILYIPLVFCAFWFRSLSMAFVFATIGTVLIIAGYFTSPDRLQHAHFLVDKVLVVAALWAVAILVYKTLQKSRNTTHQNKILQESEGQFRLLVEGVVDYAIYMLDKDGYVKTWNSGAERLKQYTAEEVIGKHFSMFYTQEDIAKGIPVLALETAKKEGKFFADGWRVRKDGSCFWANVTVDVLRNSKDDVVGFAKITRDNTDKRAIELALEQEKTGLQTILDTSVDCIITITSHGIIESFNPAAEAIFGYHAEEVLGKNVTILIPEPDKSLHNSYIFNYIATGKKKVIGTGGREIHAQRKDGTIFPAILGVNTFEIDGERKFVGSVRDITAYKEAQERYILAVEGSAVGLWDWNVKTNVLFWSDTFKYIVGVTDKDFVPEFREFESRLHPEDHDTIMAALNSHLEKKTPYDVEYRLKRGDGSYVWIHAKGQALWDEAGKPVRMAGSVEDITQRKETEQVLKKKSKEFLNLALSGSNLSVWEWSIRSGKLTIDDRLAMILGYEKDEISPNIDSWEALINPSDLTEYAKKLEKHFDEKTPVCEAELRMLAKNGEWRWILSRGNVIEYDANGSPLRAAGTYHDITERKTMEEELRTLYTELLEAKEAAEKAKAVAENANRAKSDFLSNMSHEIRTPMNAIVGVSNLLRGMRLTAQQRHYTEIAAASSNALLQIIDDVLDLSKIEAGKLTLEEVPFNLNSICEDMAELMAVKTREKRLEFLLHYGMDCPRFFVGDPGRIRQIILNLCSNAIKFTEKGHILLDVSCESVSNGKAVLKVAVTDTGVGIPEEKIGTIFGKFEQVDSSTTRKYGGTGIGLSISMQLVQLMYGAIAVESVEGKGSTFWFRIVLPCAEGEKPKALPGNASLKGVRVLVVDDNEISSDIIRDQLQPLGVYVASAINGKTAMEILKKTAEQGTPFQCAFIDYIMPDMDGLQLMKAIRKDAALNGLQCIMVSSQIVPGDIAAVKQCGFQGYLDKPLRQGDVASMLALLLEAEKENKNIDFLTSFSLQKPANENQERQDIPYFEGVRVLLVEDNWANQEVMSATLVTYGIHPMVASNGKEAIAHIKNYVFDLVFMDCQMPEMDGFETTEEIRRMEQDSKEHITIIALTANAMKADKDHCIQAGMDDYLSKPINTDELEKVFHRWLPSEKRTKRPISQAMVEDSKETTEEMPEQKKDDVPLQHSFNLVQLDKMRRMLKDRFPEVIRGYLEDAEKYIATAKEALAAHDLDKVAKNVHPLKSSSAGFGVMGVSQLAAAIEQDAKAGLEQGEGESLQALLSQLEEAFSYASLKLNNFLNKVA